jgi:ABC-type Mn2+/Zn2+ transport system permease subunit
MSWLPVTPQDLDQAFRTIAVGVACSVPCALLGCYLVLRRLSLLGDAISHAVLPGIALGFLLTGSVTGPAIVLGAMAVGVLTAVLTQALNSLGRVPEDAGMGVVFTTLFALGVILITNFAAHTDLDPGCALYGQMEFVAAAGNDFNLFGLALPRALLTMAPVLALTVAFVLLLWKELKLVAFDPDLAAAIGIPAGVVYYLLMAMVAGATVAAFEAVGAILVVAMLIVPAATAHLLTDRLAWMMAWAAAVAVLTAVFGYLAAAWLDTSTAGMMAVVAGAQFALAVLFAPRHGALSKVLRTARLALRIAGEDVLALLYRREEAAEPEMALAELRRAAGGMTGRLAVSVLRWQGQLAATPEGRVRLTVPGRRRAESLVRAHRLWEAYAGENLGLPPDHLHEPATRMEHYIGPELQSELAEQLGRPGVDPHGKAIPPPREP